MTTYRVKQLIKQVIPAQSQEIEKLSQQKFFHLGDAGLSIQTLRWRYRPLAVATVRHFAVTSLRAVLKQFRSLLFLLFEFVYNPGFLLMRRVDSSSLIQLLHV
jgi:hypothetical protein